MKKKEFDALSRAEFLAKEHEKAVVNDIKSDLYARAQARKPYESQWRLNMNFAMGNQYCSIMPNSEVENYEKRYYWQEREVYNHIATVLEIRASKLNSYRPEMSVIPSSASIADVSAGRLSKSVINSLNHKLKINEIVTSATTWSEVCGTSFYKVVWNKNAGRVLAVDKDGAQICEGEVEVTAVPPFEIYPYSSSVEKLEDNCSIIHARAYPVTTIKDIWGVDVNAENVDVFSLGASANVSGYGYTQNVLSCASSTPKDYALVIERYTLPTSKYANGRLEIIAGDRLVYEGDLPFVNGVDGKRGYPFIKQVALPNAGSFWGTSVVERCIPVQRAYNALKNRKQEFLNRLSMGVIMVEDGAVDTDNLEEEGLCPGKVIVYRQGANPPVMMEANKLPVDFDAEESRLLNEFNSISGVNDLVQITKLSTLSGNAIERLLESNSERLSVSMDSIKFAIIELTKQCLRLYKQFALTPRLAKITGEGDSVDMVYFLGSELGSDDVVCETQNSLSDSKATRRTQILQMLDAGLFADENGKMSKFTKNKVLSLLGMNIYDVNQDLSTLHSKRAQKENVEFLSGNEVQVEDYDDHDIHIKEHTTFLLCGDSEDVRRDPVKKKTILEHIAKHKMALREQQTNL